LQCRRDLFIEKLFAVAAQDTSNLLIWQEFLAIERARHLGWSPRLLPDGMDNTRRNDHRVKIAGEALGWAAIFSAQSGI
jgi:hypothetical protein